MKLYIIFTCGILYMCCQKKIVGEPFISCVIGALNKCFGSSKDMQDYSIPKSDAKLISFQTKPNETACFNMCAENLRCFMAAFRKDNFTCYMYENISYINSIDQTYALYFWRCCNMNTSYKTPKRCPGFWKYKDNFISVNTKRPHDPIVQLNTTSMYDCQILCLHNPICGSINVITLDNSEQVYCEFIIMYPVEKWKLEFRWDWSTYIWQCASNYTVPDPIKKCKSRLGMDPGYFIIENSSIPMTKNLKSLLFFHTYNYKACFENCMKYKHCNRVWYSVTSLFCILESDEYSSCAGKQINNDNVYATYRWKVCTFNESVPQNELQSGTCHKIVNNQYMYVHHTNCAYLPSDIKNTYPCASTIPIPPVNTIPYFYQNFHCQKGQSFQIINKIEKKMLISNRFSNLTWVRVFTGYESFWLANVSDISFPECRDSECDIFNADMDSYDSKHFKIISRKMWFAKKSTGPEPRFSNSPVPFVVITDTENPFCNCFTVEACSYQMRMIQDILIGFFAIPYSFVVTGDGVIYEAKGWKYRTQATGLQYNQQSISIALCGRYLMEPSVIIMESVKKTIQLSIKNKKLVKDYTIYLLKDVGMHMKLPAAGLSSVIELWPRYRGHVKYKCKNLGFVIIFLNIFSSFVVLGLTILFIHIFIIRIYHNSLCKTVLKCRIETVYGNFEMNNNFHPRIVVKNTGHLKNQNNFFSPFTTSLLWIEDKLEYGNGSNTELKCKCKADIFSMFNLQRFQSKLVDLGSVALLQEMKSCNRYMGLVFEKHSDMENQMLLILHCTNSKSVEQFIFRLCNGQCLCLLYSMSIYSPNTEALLFGHRSGERGKSVMTNRLCREDITKQYSFRLDENNNLCFYR